MFSYILFYKPFQVLSRFSAEGDKKTLADFFTGLSKDIYPVGRLDYDSEGLLLLTDDKQLTHRLLDPKFRHPRTYWVQVEGIPAKEALRKLESGLFISVNGKSYKTAPAKAKLMEHEPAGLPERFPPIRFRKNIPDSWIELTLTEGKNRQVRKMTAAAGFPTLRLIRCRIGKTGIEDLKPGECRILSIPEKNDLMKG